MRLRLVPVLPRAAWLVLAGDALSALGSGLTAPFFLVYLTHVRGIDVGVSGLALATVALVGLAGNPLGGWWSDRIGSRRTLIGGLLVAAAGAWLIAVVQEPWQAFAAAGVVGFGVAVIWPAQDSLLATVVSASARSSVFAVRHATFNAGLGAGGLIGAVMVDLGSPASFVVLYLADGLTFLAFVPVLLVLRGIGNVVHAADRTVTSAAEATPGGWLPVLRDRTFLRVWLLTVLLVAVGPAQVHAVFPAFAIGAAGIGAAGLSIAFAANMFAVVAVQLLMLRWLAGWRRSTGIALALGLWGVCWIVTLLGGGLGGGTLAVAVFAAALVVFALGETVLAPSLAPLVNDLAPDAMRGRYNGMSTLAWTTGFAAGPIIAGIAVGAEAGRALLVGLVVACGLAGLGALRLARHLPQAANTIGPTDDPVAAPDAR